jgi:hypothetical protein
MSSPDPIPAPVRAESDTLIAEAEAHRCNDNRLLGSLTYCIKCGERWPCLPHRLTAHLRAAEQAAKEAEHARDNWHAVVKDICDEWSEANGATCNESCSSYGHTDGCKATYIAEYLKSLRAALSAAEQAKAVAEAEWTAKYLQCHELLKHNTEALGAARRQLAGHRGPMPTRSFLHNDTQDAYNAWIEARNKLLHQLQDAARWRALKGQLTICTEGPHWDHGGVWFSGPVVDLPEPRSPIPSPDEYADALIARQTASQPEETGR